MKIAVTYDNGEVFQHFGHTESFKVYETEDGKIVSSEVIGTDGNGHEALAAYLGEQGIDALICGGIGAGAEAALSSVGVQVCSGAKGNADAAVEAFLKGELENEGVNCDHHDEHEHEEGHDCGGHCGSCGGCHPMMPTVEGPNVGKTVRVHYKGTLDDGSQFDSSYDRGEPLEFICGMGMMILGFDEAVAQMKQGEIVNVRLTPDKAYGEHDERAVYTFPIAELSGSEDLTVGERVALYDSMGRPVPVTVVAKDDTNITLDANHEMAGKTLNFQIELVEIIEH